MDPLGGSPVPWANGELPEEIKRKGGGSWTWRIDEDASRRIICLARDGARLFLDDQLVVECPAGLPYVPATHRAPRESRVDLEMTAGVHRVRVELNSFDPRQDASVILAYSNLHICPWTNDELPYAADLPSG